MIHILRRQSLLSLAMQEHFDLFRGDLNQRQIRQLRREQIAANGAQVVAMGWRPSGIRLQPPLEQCPERPAPIFGRERLQAEPLPLASPPVVLGESSSLGLGSRGRRNLPPDSRSVLDSKVPTLSSLKDRGWYFSAPGRVGIQNRPTLGQADLLKTYLHFLLS